MEIIYYTAVTNVGDLYTSFINEKIIIMFKDNAPEELSEYCVLHHKNQRNDEMNLGDILIIDDEEYLITAIGCDVVENLDNLGHITLRFDGIKEASLPGTIHLEDKNIVDIKNGTIIKIIRR